MDRADVQHLQHRHRWHLHQWRLQQRHRGLHCRGRFAEDPQPAHQQRRRWQCLPGGELDRGGGKRGRCRSGGRGPAGQCSRRQQRGGRQRASSSAGNSVALGAGSVASVGAQSGYTGAYGQAGASSSAGEVSIGSSGSERKITHVADGSDDHDATNVGQLKNGMPSPATSCSTRTAPSPTTFGGSTAYNGSTNVWTAPTFSISSIATDGTFTSGDYNNVTAAFTAVDGSLRILNQRISNGGGGSAYLAVNSTAAAASAAGAEAVAVGPQASAAGANSVAVGNGPAAAPATAWRWQVRWPASVRRVAIPGLTGRPAPAVPLARCRSAAVAANARSRMSPTVPDDHDATNVGQLKNGVNYAIDQSKAYTDQKIQNITNVAGSFRANNTNNLADPSPAVPTRPPVVQAPARPGPTRRAGQWFTGAGRQLGGAGCGLGQPCQHGLGGCQRCRTPGGQRGRRFAGHRRGQRAPAAGLAAGHDPLRHHGQWGH